MTSTATTPTPSPGTPSGMRTGEFCQLNIQANLCQVLHLKGLKLPQAPRRGWLRGQLCPSGTGHDVLEKWPP